MTISHPPRDMPADAMFVFARLADISCSICAPNATVKEAVEFFAQQECGYAIGGWEAVDKSKVGFGDATPNPCNIDPANRRHWFLLAGLQAAAMGLKTKK